MAIYKVCSLDVWGNAEDGWDVNDLFVQGRIELADSDGKDEILAKLMAEGFLRAGLRLDIDDSDAWLITIDFAHNGMPLLQLRRELDKDE